MTLLLSKGRQTAKRLGNNRFLLCFIVLNILVASLIGSTLFFQTSRTLEEQMVNENQTMLKQLNKSMDVLVTQIDSLLSQMAQNPEIYNFIQYYNANDYGKQIKITNDLNHILLFNSYICSVKIVYFKEKKVFYLNNGVFDFDDFFDKEIFDKIHYNNMRFEWIPGRVVYDSKIGEKVNAITVIKPIPQMYYDLDVVAVIDIDEKYLMDIVGSIIARDDTEVFVVNKNNEIVLNNKKNRFYGAKDAQDAIKAMADNRDGHRSITIGKERALFSYVTSDLNEWKYLSLISYNAINRRIDSIKKYTVLISLMVLAVGFVFSFVMSNKLNKPIKMIAGLFKNNDCQLGKVDDIQYIERNVSRLIEKNESIQKTLLNSIPVLANSFLLSLIKGQIKDRNEIDKALADYNIRREIFNNFLVMVISAERFRFLQSEAAGCKMNLFDFNFRASINTQHNYGCNAVEVNTGLDEIAVILSFPEKQDWHALKSLCQEIGAHIQKQIMVQTGYDSVIAVGGVYEDIINLPDSYNEAAETLQYKYIIGLNKVVFFSEIEIMKAENYAYPFEEEKKLLDALKQNNFVSAIQLHDEMFNKFVDKGDFYKTAFYCLQLVSSITRSMHEANINLEEIYGKKDLYEDILLCSGIIELQDWFKQLYIKIINIGKKDRDSTKSNLIADSIEAYIRENYDKDLSLQNLSKQVYMSISYLCKTYKDETGKSLKHFINEVRIEKAKEFLKCPEYRISDVAEKVGYDKVHGFLKFFKEYAGMTPKEYRMSLIKAEFREGGENNAMSLPDTATIPLN